MHSDSDLVGRGKHPGVGHLPRIPRGILDPLGTQCQLPGQLQGLSGSAPLQPALRRRPQPVGEVIHGTSQRRRINHAVSVRVASRLLPTGERSGTVT